jgi:putative ABC transport system ATP-binding protein
MLQTVGVEFSYPEQQFQFPDMHLEKGDKCLIHGLSGTGKSTLLHLLAGLLVPSSGSIEIGDTKFSDLSKDSLQLWRGIHIGMVLQYPVFPKDVTCGELLELKLKWANQSVDIHSALERIDLSEKVNHYPHQLSGGERQRLALLLACIHQPDVVLIDEASSHLDDLRTEQLLTTIQELISTDTIVVFVSHDHRIRLFFNRTIEL